MLRHTVLSPASSSFPAAWSSQQVRRTFSGVRHQQLTPVILATLEAEIGRIMGQDQPREKVSKLSTNN
jgi:hypothetical protein